MATVEHDVKAMVNHFVEQVWIKNNLAIADELVSPDFVNHDAASPEEARGPQGFKQHVLMTRRAFPDLTFTIDDHVAEGDKVVTRWTIRGTHRGELNGIPPTGKPVVIPGISVIRVADGKVVERWGISDRLSVAQQIGAIPNPEAGLMGLVRFLGLAVRRARNMRKKQRAGT